MLDDRERRALEELERSYAADVGEPERPVRPVRHSGRRRDRPPGSRSALVLFGACAVLVLTGAPVAGLALALATAIGWSYGWLWAHRADGVDAWVPPWADGDRVWPGASIRRYLAWLADAA